MRRVSEWHRKCLLFLLSVNVKRINSATWFRLCRNLIPYWILDILCGIYFFSSLDFYLWSFISSKSLETHPRAEIEEKKRIRVCVSGSACPAYVGIRCSLYYMSRFSRVDEPDSHDIPDKAAARSPVRPIGTFIIYPSSAFASAHFSRLLNRRNIYRRHTYLFCVAQKNVSDVLSPAAPYSHSMSAVAWRAVFMAMGEHRGISVIVESMKRKSGVRRENDIKRDFNMMARSRSTLSYILFCRRRCDYSLHGYTMAIVCVCVRPVDDESATPENIYTYMYISVYIEHINSIFDARVVEQ